MLEVLLLLALRGGDTEPPAEVALDSGLQSVRAGEFADAITNLEQALWWDPNVVEAYEPLSVAYEKQGKTDLAIYYGDLSLGVLRSAEKPDPKAIAATMARIRSMLGAGTQDLQATAETGMIDLAKKYLAKKRYQTAAFWLSQVVSLDPLDKDVAPLQEQVVKNTTGGAALKLQKKLSERSPTWIARMDKAHHDWSKCYEGKTKYYRLKTNIGYEVFQTFFFSLDQLNRFYREVFGYKGPDPPVLTVQAFATREDFNKQDSVTNPGVKGYYNSSNINTYDLRIDGFGLEDLYSTIFHEASHQFIDLVTGTPPPMYLNEGISSYFEGARILPDGTVQTNEIPPHRLRGLAGTLGKSDEIPLERLLRAQKPEYEVTHYCYGWGLMYFLMNYEDKSLNTPYKQPLMKLLETYKKGGKHDVVKRFEEMVLKPVEGPKTVTDLQPVWRQWMEDLIAEYRQGAAASSRWLERAQAYLDKNRLDKAEATLKKVIAWLPDDPHAHLLLARTYQRLKDDDRALHHLFVARDRARGNAQLVQQVDELVRSVDPIADDRLAVEKIQRDATVAQAKALVAAQMPRAARLSLATLERSFGYQPAIADLKAEVLKQGGALTRRWSLFRGDSVTNWEAGKSLSVDGTAMTFASEEGGQIVREVGSYSTPFTVHLDIDPPEGSGAIFGFVYGWRWGERASFLVWDRRKRILHDGHVEFSVDPKTSRYDISPVPDADVPGPEPKGELVFEVTDERFTARVGDVPVFTKELSPGTAQGKIGLFLEAGKVRIKKIEIEQGS